jgi:iron complex transport system permease protein
VNKSIINSIKFSVISLVLLALLFLDLSTGHIKIPLSEILKYLCFSNEVSDQYFLLIKEFRVPRVFVAVFAGAALSVSGLAMQTIFRNPLAGPYVLGVSSGASLGVALVVLGAETLFNSGNAILSNSIIVIAAAIGSAVVLLIILAVSMRVKDILSILIIGILIAGVVSSIVSLLQFFANDINVKSFVVWTMGSLSAVSHDDIMLLFPVIAFGITMIYFLSKPLNLILPGEDFAVSLGVNVFLIRILIFIAVSLLAGAVTAFCGPLGFIGIAVPHVARWIFNTSNHFILIPASIIIGGIFMLCGDLLTLSISNHGVLPINAITALLGAPFIVWIVFKNQRTIV